jgi:hypothetical protein
MCKLNALVDSILRYVNVEPNVERENYIADVCLFASHVVSARALTIRIGPSSTVFLTGHLSVCAFVSNICTFSWFPVKHCLLKIEILIILQFLVPTCSFVWV